MMRKTLLFITAACCLLVARATASDSLSHGKIPIGERENSVEAANDYYAGHYEEAAAIYQTMAENHSGSLFAWANLGVTRYQQGKLEAARDAFQHAINLDPKDAPSFAALGMTNYELGNYKDAMENLRTAVGLNPDDVLAHDYLAYAYDQLDMNDAAQAEREKSAKLKAMKVAAGAPVPNAH
jgi:tetratricopeptide (TPR) repeat protein